MKKFILSSLFVFILLIQVVNASDVTSCTISPQEVDLSKSDQVAVTIQLNNTKNETANDTVEISFPTTYLSCVGDCSKQMTLSAYSSGSASFTLKALSATTETQSITVTKPASYTCPAVTKITAKDTIPPTVGSVTPTSVAPSISTTFSATVSDDVGVTTCNFALSDKTYSASVSGGKASYTTSLSEGTYSMYFKCSDAAGNVGTGSTTTVTVAKQKLSASISLPRTTYYPADSLEPKVTVTDPNGKIVIDAFVTGNLTYGTKYSSLTFYYSSLCDCYKAYYWFTEGAHIDHSSLHERCLIGSYAEISDSIIGTNTRIRSSMENPTKLHHYVFVGIDSEIGEGSKISDNSFISPKGKIPPNTKMKGERL